MKDGYLINPKEYARTEITTELLSKKGYFYKGVDEDGNDVEDTFKQKDFEKKFFSENTTLFFVKPFFNMLCETLTLMR